MKKKILVVDDDPAIRKSFVLALEDSGFQVDTSESAEEGITMHKENTYELIFLDLKMPGKDGVYALKEIRKKNKTVPIYIITAFYAEYFEELKQASTQGLDFEVLRKPIGADQICMVAETITQGAIGYV
jgi:DNA-binding response OmpR family regulator